MPTVTPNREPCPARARDGLCRAQLATLEFSRDRKSMSVLVARGGNGKAAGRRGTATDNSLFVKVSDLIHRRVARHSVTLR